MKLVHAVPIAAVLLAGALPQGRRLVIERDTPDRPAGAVLLTGRVTHAVSGQPLAGVRISVDATRHTTRTDTDGTYRLELPSSLDGATRTLVAELAGYLSVRRALYLNERQVRTDLVLAPTVSEHEEMAAVGAAADAALRATTEQKHVMPQMSASIAAPPPSGAVSELDHYRRQNEGWNTESYDLIEDNAFRPVRTNPLSTFSIDVDRASYSNVRRFLESGQLPPKDAVRIEEMINYFHYANAEPRGDEPFAVTTELMPAPWQPRHQLLRIALQAQRLDTESLPPSNLVFLLDVSGSMATPDKLPLLRQAMQLLVQELRPQDRIAIVVYAGSAGLVLPSTPGTHKDRIARALDQLEAGGSTAGGAGIRLAYDVAREHHIEGGNNRVILATDGDFNVGVSSDAEMVRLIEEKRRQGTFLTVLGFGTGNLKDSKMEKLADHGNGNYAYIDNIGEARKVLVTEIGGTLYTVARDVKLQVEFNPERVRAYRLIGYENRVLPAEDFDDDRKDAGELGAGHTVTALYEIVPVGVTGTVDVGESGELRYQERRGVAGGARELAFVKLRYKQPDGATSRLLEMPVRVKSAARASDDLRFAAAVAAFGMLLRESEHRGAATYDGVLTLARNAIGSDDGGYRAEFVRLVQTAQELVTPRRAQGGGNW